MLPPIALLYIDDEPINLLVFAYNFKARHRVITGASGEEGLRLLTEHPDISVVISDMRMPGMNGLEFIRQAKGRFPAVSFYILTGFDITEDIAQALEQGLIKQYFRKPFSIEEIDAAIRGLAGP